MVTKLSLLEVIIHEGGGGGSLLEVLCRTDAIDFDISYYASLNLNDCLHGL